MVSLYDLNASAFAAGLRRIRRQRGRQPACRPAVTSDADAKRLLYPPIHL